MISKIGNIIRDLRSKTSGNALMLLGIGLPAFIGAAGLAVDTAQWYQWKRELQFATDQAALAGAYARGSNNTENTYATRATAEFNGNLSTIASFTSAPTVSLADYNHGNNNSVVVSASATKTLPFSGLLIGRPVTVSATSQASFTDGGNINGCLKAVNRTASGDITIEGSTILQGRCGLVSLSNATDSIIVNGNPTLDVGWVASRGGVDDYFNSLQNTQVLEYVNNLSDQFASLTPPINSTPRTYSCTTTSSSTTSGTETTYTYTEVWTGSKKNNMTLSSTTQSNPVINGPTTITERPTIATDVSGSHTGTYGLISSVDSGNGSTGYTTTKTYTRTDTNYTITVVTTAGGTMNPGTYVGGVSISCNTTMNPGIYVMDGGDFQTNAQYTVTGSGVMIVLKNGAGLVINGGANINLTAMSSTQLQAAGVPNSGTSSADALAGMLIFEDRLSQGVNKNHNKINGNASTVLNGTIYMPVSNVTLSGTATVSSQCLMISANQITLAGNLDMTTFCPAGLTFNEYDGDNPPIVKLVA